MTNLVSILAFGFWLGMRHAADADHVVAVSTIVSRQKKFGTAWLLGVFWGIGHTITIFIVGVGIILLKINIPPRVGLSMEFAVGLVLIILGLLNMAGYHLGAAGATVHSHENSPPHVHGPALGRLDRFIEQVGRFQILRSLFVGLVHGLAGSAAVALLVLATITSPRAAVFYLAIFGLGTLAGMLLLSSIMEFSMVYLARWWSRADRLLTVGTGLLSLLFGLYVAYQIGWVDGLFLPQTHWTPQ
jgi:high-affinity nickel-transport protein